MGLTLTDLAERIGAVVQGDGRIEVTGCAGLADAGPEDVSFVANPRYVKHLQTTQAGAVIVSPAEAKEAGERTLLVADDPYFAFRQAVVALYGFRRQPTPGISELAVVDPSAQVGEGCSIQPFAVIAADAVIGDRCVIYPHCYVGPRARIGDDCILYPNVTVYDDCVLGHRVTLHAGCVIGQDGFGYATHALEGEPPRHHKIPQIGNAVVEDDVEMGANCAIDRATVGSTVVGRGTKFSDMVTIGHGTKVGPHNLLVAQVGLAGSVQTGQYVVMGGQVGAAGHLTVGDGAQFAGKSAIVTDIPPGKGPYGGIPAIPLNIAKRNALFSAQMPDFIKNVRKMQKRLEKVEAELDKLKQDGDTTQA